jgi:hypothetical protein
VPEVDCQRRGTHSATVVKLDLIWLIRRSNLTVPLQISDYVNERGMRSRGGDDASSCLFDYAEPIAPMLVARECSLWLIAINPFWEFMLGLLRI